MYDGACVMEDDTLMVSLTDGVIEFGGVDDGEVSVDGGRKTLIFGWAMPSC